MNLAVRVEGPDGQVRDLFTSPVLMEGEDRGVSFIGETTMGFEMEGLYWFDVFADGTFLTRMPLRVVVFHQQIQTGTLPPGA